MNGIVFALLFGAVMYLGFSAEYGGESISKDDEKDGER